MLSLCQGLPLLQNHVEKPSASKTHHRFVSQAPGGSLPRPPPPASLWSTGLAQGLQKGESTPGFVGITAGFREEGFQGGVIFKPEGPAGGGQGDIGAEELAWAELTREGSSVRAVPQGTGEDTVHP